MVGVLMGVGVAVIAPWSTVCASSSETISNSPGEQYCPDSVQAIVSSSPVMAWGSEGPLMDWVPFSPPS
jgi:hypothetical protein